MDVAIIVRKYEDDSVELLRSTQHPPSAELQAQAKELDRFLKRKMIDVERKLENLGVLPKNEKKESKSGNVSLWYAVGTELRAISKKVKIEGRRERRWLWEAIQNLHAGNRLRRAERRRDRNHFEYCYRLSQFAKPIAEQLNWSEWVYFFDSLTVREEARADGWIAKKLSRASNADRRFFRRFTQNLNHRIKPLDTSVLKDSELFQIYEAVWSFTEKELS